MSSAANTDGCKRHGPWGDGDDACTCPPTQMEKREDLLDGLEQKVVDDFFAFVGEHSLDEDETYRQISRLTEALYMGAQERYG